MSEQLFRRLNLPTSLTTVCHRDWVTAPGGAVLDTINPSTGTVIATVKQGNSADYDAVAESARTAFLRWRTVPAPLRGELIRKLGNRLREAKKDLAQLITLEVGKITSEAEGEVQEMIDMCDFAVGLSRQLHGLTIATERPEHRMMEQWHPLGPVGIITAFNFPVAVWAWNACLAAVCGNSMIWKPSALAPLCAIAVQQICLELTQGTDAEGIFGLILGDNSEVAEALTHDARVPLISATGSCAMGRRVGPVVAGRFGRTLLELGGNNAVIVAPSADLKLALRACAFAAVGTAGQRCTSLRRLYLHRSIASSFAEQLVNVFKSVRIGSPSEPGTLVGPLISSSAVTGMMDSIEQAVAQGGKVLVGGKSRAGDGFFVEPTIIEAANDLPIMQHETFAPLLYITPYDDLDDAIRRQNNVPQGLSSAIFTNDIREAERFVSAVGSDCGIANVNIGTSGAEIGGAFGGEKETGGGREAGSDAWKAYMRRQTCTINYGKALPLAQGVTFDIDGV